MLSCRSQCCGLSPEKTCSTTCLPSSVVGVLEKVPVTPRHAVHQPVRSLDIHAEPAPRSRGLRHLVVDIDCQTTAWWSPSQLDHPSARSMPVQLQVLTRGSWYLAWGGICWSTPQPASQWLVVHCSIHHRLWPASKHELHQSPPKLDLAIHDPAHWSASRWASAGCEGSLTAVLLHAEVQLSFHSSLLVHLPFLRLQGPLRWRCHHLHFQDYQTSTLLVM